MDTTMTLYHGSSTVIEKPIYGLGNPKNDYGLGFYCTMDKNLACEWACPTRTNGVCNSYRLDLDSLGILDLTQSEYNIFNWLALLVQNRSFESTNVLMKHAKEWLLANHLPRTQGADIIIGMRADDSYYSFARSFLDGRLSLNEFSKAMTLGGLGYQVVLKSPMAFDQLKFIEATPVDAQTWFFKRQRRDELARKDYQTLVNSSVWSPDVRYIADFMRAEGKK